MDLELMLRIADRYGITVTKNEEGAGGFVDEKGMHSSLNGDALFNWEINITTSSFETTEPGYHFSEIFDSLFDVQSNGVLAA